MFGRKEKTETPAKSDPAAPLAGATDEGDLRNAAEAKKNRPTPKRNRQQALNSTPLGATRDKQQTKQARDDLRRRRDEARQGVIRGEEKYLSTRDKGPQRRYARDFVDARFSMGELFIPIALVVLIAGMFTGPSGAVYSNLAVYALITLVALDTAFMIFQLRGRMRIKFGEIQKWTGFYAFMRSVQIRALRIPKPGVRRREYPE